MDKMSNKVVRRSRRRTGIRKRIMGTAERPRLSVYKSLGHMYAQVIDDLQGKTLASSSTRDAELRLGATGNSAAATAVGESIGKKALAAGVKEVAFDRGGFKFHGRVKALAEGARKAGLKF